MPWDPDRYHQFRRERTAPFDDLLALVRRRSDLRVVDLGCGTGELTASLADALPGSDVLGVDTSPEMLKKAAEFSRPGLRFEHRPLEGVDGGWDLVFSNAALQWVDDHATLIPHLLSLLHPGGQLAVQVPSNHDHPTHTLIHETAAEEPFRTALDGWSRHSPVLAVERYAAMLHASGGIELTVFEKVYPHVLANADALLEWTSGTALVPYFERLHPALKERFIERYRQKLRERYPEAPVFYGFKRILFSVTM